MLNPVDILKTLLSPRYRPAKWQLLHDDGRVLSVANLQENHLGNSIQLNVPTTAGVDTSSSILDARAVNAASPEVVTIDLGVEVPNGIGNAMVTPQAHVVWGCAGAKFEADVDVLKGTQLTVAANYVQVSGVYHADIILNLPIIRMSANLSYGARGGARTPPRFTVSGTLAAAGSPGDLVSFTIPNFATEVTIYGMKADATALTDLDIFWNRSDTTTQDIGWIAQHQLTAPNTVPSRPYAIPGFARRVAIQNVPASASFVTLVFGLSL